MTTPKLGFLGPWEKADLAATAARYAGLGADADVPAPVRFVSGVAKLVKRRAAVSSASGDPARVAIFLLQATPHPNHQCKRVPMLDSGQTPVSGRLWYVSPPVNNGRYIELDDIDDDALFTTVTELDLGNVPAVLFDPRLSPPTIRYYPKGFSDLDECEVYPIGDIPITIERIVSAIERVYLHSLRTPEAQPTEGKLWKNQEKWHPIKSAEGAIQVALKAGLVGAFLTCVVRHEQLITSGRFDLIIEEKDVLDPIKITRHAVLELKVLRSFTNTGKSVSLSETLEWIRSGVKQAGAYMKELEAKLALLACFDMRKEPTGDQCFDDVRALATTHQVQLRVWFLFSTSTRFREYEIN